MKTEYKILWIDDRPKSVVTDKAQLSDFLESHGIELIVHSIDVIAGKPPTKDPAFNQALGDLDLDMIFIDFNMPAQNGDVIIEHIRNVEHHYHIPILFYTGEEEELALETTILNINDHQDDFRKKVDGIYFCHRDHIFTKARLILTSLLKKESRLQYGRGLLMDRVSEIDAKVIRALEKYLDEVPGINREKIKKKIISKLEARRNKYVEVVDFLQDKSYEEVIAYLLNNDRVIDTHFRAELLREMLRYIKDEIPKGEILSTFYNSNPDKSLPRCLVELRNVYAHQTAEEISSQHDEEKCKYVRVETRRHLKNLYELLQEA